MKELVKELYKVVKSTRRYTENSQEIVVRINDMSENELKELRDLVVMYTDEDESIETFYKMMGLTSIIDMVIYEKFYFIK